VRKRRTFEHRTSRVRKRRHAANLAPPPRAIALPHAPVNQPNSIVAQQLLCRQDGHPANACARFPQSAGTAREPRPELAGSDDPRQHQPMIGTQLGGPLRRVSASS
jgi:hypothetical protein